MFVKSLELENFRNYKYLNLSFDKGVNILYGDNGQGKTNVLEAIYVSATTKSHKSSKDKEIIHFDAEEAHIKTILERDELERRIDMHLRKNKSKGIAVDKVRLKKAVELLGLLKVVFFSPEDLSIIKNEPDKRRRFVDMELCQIDSLYVNDLNNYNKILNQRNTLLKDMYFHPEYKDMLPIYDMQLASYGSRLIKRRKEFTEELNLIIKEIHKNISGSLEELIMNYHPSVTEEEFEDTLVKNREKDLKMKMTCCGPHRDDFSFYSNGINLRTYGSQGQQRSAALSLKLSEIALVQKITKDNPILLLDDVLSELDSKRQNHLIESIGDIQTILTCTGVDDFIHSRMQVNKVFNVSNGTITCGN
ncbi:MAG: DNA replication/repair protein RecF [Lachnospiraceae bacterium]|nr:DNA replication/repair protein RecF [Lachnospiraceae bacterium]